MKELIIKGNKIEWDETLVHVFYFEDKPEYCYIEAVSNFNKRSQMIEVPADKIHKIRAVIESETEKELSKNRWKHIKSRETKLRSKYEYENGHRYLGVSFEGFFRHVSSEEDFMLPHRYGYSKSFFYKKIVDLGFEPITGGCSLYSCGTLIDIAKNVRSWYQMKLLMKTDYIRVESPYVGDCFETTVGTLIKFLYSKNKKKFYRKHFM